MAIAVSRKRQSSSTRRLVVRAHQDGRTGIWWADSEDVPGLVTEAPTYHELVDRIAGIAPELCKANNIPLRDGDVFQIIPYRGVPAMTKEELDDALSRLGERIWDAISSDDHAFDLLHDLVESKLALDGVERTESELSDAAAQAIFSEQDPENPQIVRPKEFVESREWAKNSLYNLTLHWVLDQALARMKIRHRFASEVGQHDP
jgi:hypothetical protein